MPSEAMEPHFCALVLWTTVNLAETNQKHSSSLRKCAEFMLNSIILSFSTVNSVAFLICGALSFYAFILWMVKSRYSSVYSRKKEKIEFASF